MNASRWTDEDIERMRTIGDPLADNAVAAVFEHGGGAEGVHQLLVRLFAPDTTGAGHDVLRARFDSAADTPLPDEVRRYLEEGHRLPGWARLPEKQQLIHEGGTVGLEFGLMVSTLLACASLPECYVMAKGVKVLAYTGRLDEHTRRRLLETAQFIMDIAHSGNVIPANSGDGDGAPPGELPRGIQSALRVRLMHASIRYLIQHGGKVEGREKTSADVANQWVPTDGKPINQEDLVYTLMTFSWVPIRVLRDFGLRPDQELAFLTRWNLVGHFMGVREDLLPATVDEAEALFEQIKTRQKGSTGPGRALTRHLLEYVRSVMPFGCKGLPKILIHTYVGTETASILGVSPPGFLERLAIRVVKVILGWIVRAVDDAYRDDSGLGPVSVWLHRRLLMALAHMSPDGFRIPPDFWSDEVFGHHRAVQR
ncbi:MAG: DUF2236 domain-containing protein [Acidobacteria bacterium]|nr:DUF2236 domain-containing protein [Acidobacteriota bacterium]